MKKALFTIFTLFVIVFTIGLVAAENEIIRNCSETDEAIDYYVKGINTYLDNSQNLVNVSDTCRGGDLIEYHCYQKNESTDSAILEKYYSCPEGCFDGACIKEGEDKNDTEICDEGKGWTSNSECICEENEKKIPYVPEPVEGLDGATVMQYTCEEIDEKENDTEICEDDEYMNAAGECEDLEDDDDNEVEIEFEYEREGLGQKIKGKVKAGVYTDEDGRQIRVSELAKIREEFFNGNYTIDSDLEIEIKYENETEEGKVKFKVKMKNGKLKEIKVMPNTASEKALERLKLKVCSEDNNCSIELKEVGQDANKTELRYELQVERHYKLLGMFKAKAKEKVEIDAETGEIIGKSRAWWRFLAILDEDDTSEEPYGENETNETTVPVNDTVVVNETNSTQ